MANLTSAQGISAVPNTNEGSVATRRLPVDATNTVPLRVGSPVVIDAISGKIKGLVNSVADTAKVIGSVVRAYKVSDNTTPAYIPSGTDGFGVEFSYLPDQRYQATFDTAITGNIIGQAFTITDETAQPSIYDPYFGDSISGRQLASASKDATDGQYIVQEILKQNYNSPTEAGLEVIVRINPANYQAI